MSLRKISEVDAGYVRGIMEKLASLPRQSRLMSRRDSGEGWESPKYKRVPPP